MAARRKSDLDRRLREIEREKERLRDRMQEVRQWADSVPDAAQMLAEPRLRDAAVPDAWQGEDFRRHTRGAVAETDAAVAPAGETALDFEPGPEGLDIKRVVMPRLQRTDLLRPAIGGSAAGTRLVEPEHDRFRSYFGGAGLKRVREGRQERGSQRLRTLFMLLMVLTLGIILFQMVT